MTSLLSASFRMYGFNHFLRRCSNIRRSTEQKITFNIITQCKSDLISFSSILVSSLTLHFTSSHHNAIIDQQHSGKVHQHIQCIYLCTILATHTNSWQLMFSNHTSTMPRSSSDHIMSSRSRHTMLHEQNTNHLWGKRTVAYQNVGTQITWTLFIIKEHTGLPRVH